MSVTVPLTFCPIKETALVEVAGSYNDWTKVPMTKESESSEWSISLKLEPGLHQYKYIVDGDWVVDSELPTVDDNLGGLNNLLKVAGWTCDLSLNAVKDMLTVRHGGSKGNENAWFSFVGGLGYWEFKVLGSGGFWLGVTTEANFGPGYGMKGLFFGGPGDLISELDDGGSLVERNWGPNMEEGDVIGMRLEQQGGNTILAFSKNGNGLGTAFNIQGWDEGVFVPAVSLEKPGQGVTIQEDDAPSLESMNPIQLPRKSIEGTWKLDRPGVEDHVFEITKEVLNLNNTLGVPLVTRWTARFFWANGADFLLFELKGDGLEFKVCNCGSRITMFNPSPEVEELKKEMWDVIAGITRMEWDNGELVATSRGKTFNFKEFNKVKTPATKDMVNWMNK